MRDLNRGFFALLTSLFSRPATAARALAAGKINKPANKSNSPRTLIIESSADLIDADLLPVLIIAKEQYLDRRGDRS